jgi:hypothetical protein
MDGSFLVVFAGYVKRSLPPVGGSRKIRPARSEKFENLGISPFGR